MNDVKNICVDDKLNERFLGKLNGMSYVSSEAAIAQDIPIEGMESNDVFEKRVKEVMSSILFTPSHTPIIVTSRGVIIRIFKHLCHQVIEEKDNEKIYLFRWIQEENEQGKWQVSSFLANDFS